MKRLTFLTGRAGSGKTAAVVARLAAHMRAHERAILIVPEQYTFETERRLSEQLGGLLGVEVMSIPRLIERVLASGGAAKPFLSQQGVCMVVRRAAYRSREKLEAFSRVALTQGFGEQCAALFQRFESCLITPDALFETVSKLPANSLLRGKLSDLALLYRETSAYLSERYLTEADALNEATRLLPDSVFAGAPFYFDGLESLDPALTKLMEAIFSVAPQVLVTLRGCASDAPDAALFEPDAALKRTLWNLGINCGYIVDESIQNAENRALSPELLHLERNLFAHPYTVFTEECPALRLMGASDRRAEAENVADEILTLVRRGECRYRDIAVLAPDMDAYAFTLESAFLRRGIPIFLDRTRPVTGHAAADAALCAVRCAANGFSASDLLRLAKTGYAGAAHADTEALENYLLRYGLFGSAAKSPFTRGEVPEAAERARQALTGPLLRLHAGLSEKSAAQKTEALYRYLLDIRLSEQLCTRADALRADDRIAEADEHAQVWNALVEVLSQLHAILGDTVMSMAEFASVLEEGLSVCAVGMIPATADCVLLGDVDRTRSRSVDVLFVLGVNDGLLPRERADDELICDAELSRMAESGLSVWSGTRAAAALDALSIYTAFSKARKKLCLSYVFYADGAELSPSKLILRIRALFPKLPLQSDLDQSDALPASPASGMRLLCSDLRLLLEDGITQPLLAPLYAYFSTAPAWRARARAMERAAFGGRNDAPFSPELAKRLYGTRIRMSASRLERFYACPFRHFADSGLAARVRPERQEKAADLGTFYHDALDRFLKAALAETDDPGRLTPADEARILAAVLPPLIASHHDGIFLFEPRLAAQLPLFLTTVKKSAHALLQQLAAGSFRPIGTELLFGENAPFPPIPLDLPDGTGALLYGKIDRADRARAADGTEYLRVIDYKTGGRAFDYAGVLDGLTLQLPLYLLALSACGTAAGMYYMPLSVPAPDAGEDVEAALQKLFRLRGLTLRDPAVFTASQTHCTGASSVIHQLKNGKDGFTGALIDSRELAQLMAAAKRIAAQGVSRMLSGELSILPAKKACDYCDYRTVCGFDASQPAFCRRRTHETLGYDAFFTLIGGEPQ